MNKNPNNDILHLNSALDNMEYGLAETILKSKQKIYNNIPKDWFNTTMILYSDNYIKETDDNEKRVKNFNNWS